MCSLLSTIEQALERPASKVTAPVPLPPLVVNAVSASPNVTLAGAVIARVAWVALLMVTGKAA